jgi:Domain of unknown function DUF83.
MQLASQVICLEEMYGIVIPEASLFYWETRRRDTIEMTAAIKEEAVFLFKRNAPNI